MSNRKESLKKSLGLTEYPWSSDDEDNPQTNTETVASASRRQTENNNSNQPGTSGAPSLSISPTRRNQTRLERDLFWSLLNNPHRMTAGGPSRPSTSSFEPAETHERVDLENPVSNIQRILAIKRLTRSLGANLCKHPGQRPTGSSRNIIFAPSMHANMAHTLKFGRIKRRPMSRVPPAGCSRNSIIPAVLEGPAAPPRAPHSDDETASQIRSISPENNDDNGEDHESMEVATSGGGVSLEEEIVEIDGGAEENHDENGNEEAQAEQASGEEDVNEEMTVQVATSAELQPAQGVKRKRESPEESEPDSVKEFNQVSATAGKRPLLEKYMELNPLCCSTANTLDIHVSEFVHMFLTIFFFTEHEMKFKHKGHHFLCSVPEKEKTEPFKDHFVVRLNAWRYRVKIKTIYSGLQSLKAMKKSNF